MRSFLLTWYGITDFRASLGFENTNGPIAAALVAEVYSDVVVLCYTRVDNDAHECMEAQKFFDAELKSIHDAGQEKDWKITGAFVTKFANTTIAHQHFVNWLKKKAKSVNGDTKVWFKSEKLRELNDTEGIYACAMRALDFVAKVSGEKQVTLYLSPGTPVMAFVWAFATLEYPDINKRLIVSPVVGKPPETISLPAEWLERHGANQHSPRSAENEFDVTFHLFGEQRMPSLLGIRQFESSRHVFVNSKEYPAAGMGAFIGAAGMDELPADPWDARAVHKRITQHAAKFPPNTRIGINLTGGTKLMFAGALSAARELGAIPFYFDSRNRRVTFIDSLRSAAIQPIDSVETFLLLNGDGLKLSRNGKAEEFSPDRLLLTETLWKHRSKIAGHYKQLCAINDQREKSLKNGVDPLAFRHELQDLVFELDRNNVATVVGGGLDLRFYDWPDFIKYLSGGWFEEYVYLQCKPYEDAGVIKDLRINVELHLDREYSGKQQHWNASYNELDIVFTDGHSLFIVECKAGNVTQEQIMKLQNLVRLYGGVEGRGIIACCFPPNTDSVRKKIKDARLTLCCGGEFIEQLNALMNSLVDRARSAGESM